MMLVRSLLDRSLMAFLFVASELILKSLMCMKRVKYSSVHDYKVGNS